jgi:hypothetical protein
VHISSGKTFWHFPWLTIQCILFSFTTLVSVAPEPDCVVPSGQLRAAQANRSVFYSVGQSLKDLKSGNPSLSIKGGRAVFSLPQSNNIGVGDEVTYGQNAVAYIARKTSQEKLHWDLVTADGSLPNDVDNAPVNTIKHAFSSLSSAFYGTKDDRHLGTEDLVKARVVVFLSCYFDFGPETSPVYIPSSLVTGPENYVRIYTPSNTSTEANFSQRHLGRWTPNAYTLSVVDSYAAIDVNSNFIRIEGLQINHRDTVASEVEYPRSIRIDSLQGHGGYILIKSNLIHGSFVKAKSPSGIANFASRAAPTLAIANNIVDGFVGDATEKPSAIATTSGTAFIYNNTVVDNFQGFLSKSSMVTYKNNLAQRNIVGFGVGVGADLDSSNNLSDREDAPGKSSLQASRVIFLDMSKGDFHIASLNSGALGRGANLSNDARFAFADDIDGEKRSAPWDIGADQHLDRDAPAPLITKFLMPTESTSLVVPVEVFSALDNGYSASAYLITESESTPQQTDPGWTPTPPSAFRFGGAGARTAYAWAMSPFGKISRSYKRLVSVNTDSAGGSAIARRTTAWFFGQNWNSVDDLPSIVFSGIRLWDTGTNWKQIERQRGEYDWTVLDKWLLVAKQNKKDVLYTVGVTPSWAASRPNEICPYGGTNGCASPPSDLDQDNAYWKEFITALVTHSAQSKNARINYYELWNESNSWYWSGSIAQMVRMVRDAYTIIHQIDPTARVVGPNVTGQTGSQWLDKYFSAGGATLTDIVAFHPTVDAANTQALLQDVAEYRVVMEKHDLAKHPIWATEGSWGVNTDMSDLEQIGWIGRYYLSLWNARIDRTYWYSWDSGPYGSYHRSGWGQLWDSALGPHPAALALARLFTWLDGSSQDSPCDQKIDDIWHCTLTLSHGEQADIVWVVGGTVELKPATDFRLYRTLSDDDYHAIGNNVVFVGPQPILLLENRPN